MLAALRRAEARFLVVSAHALAAHGVPRARGDLDVCIDASRESVSRIWAALAAFVGNKRAGGRRKDLADIESLAGA